MAKALRLDYQKDSELLKALAHPVRLRMVAGLCGRECNVTLMAEKLGLPQSTVSQHLGILKSRGIIAPRKEGVKTCYQVVEPRAAAILQALIR